MLFWEVWLMSFALAMDACAVAMTNGMCDVKMPVKKAKTEFYILRIYIRKRTLW